MTTVPTSNSFAWATPCNCQWADAANHDALLRIEADFATAAQLVAFTSAWADEPNRPEVAPVDLADFAAEHNWRDAVAVTRMFVALGELCGKP